MELNISDKLNNYFKEDKEDKEDKNTVDFSNLTTSKTEQTIENTNATGMETAMDIVQTVPVKYASGLSYVIDLPFMLVDLLDKGASMAFDKVASAAGFDTSETNEIKSNYIALKKENKFRPGKWLRENVLTYQPKTKTGQVVGTMAEWASPGILAKGTRAKSLLHSTGAVAGGVKEGVAQGTGSELAGVGIGLPLNIAADIYALRTGKVSMLSKNVLPSDAIIRKAKVIYADAKKHGLKLSVGEATGSQAVQSTEATLSAYMVGDAAFDKFWSTRPAQLKNYIFKWGKDNGIITAKDSTTMYKQLKKAAVALQTQRSDAWKLAGGNKIKDFTYDAQKLDNLSIELLNMAKDATPQVAKILTNQANKIKKLSVTGKNGQPLHNIYTMFRDTAFSVSGKETSVVAKTDVESYKKASNLIKELLSSNKNWGKAQDKYVKFTEELANPLTKGSITKLFNDLNDAKLVGDPKTVAKLYQYLGSEFVSAKDISKLANSLNKSKIPGLWEDVASGYFSMAFNRSAIEGIEKGKRIGVIFHDTIMKNPKQKDNFVEVLFQLAKKQNPNIKRDEIVKSVNSFSGVLQATGNYPRIGSPTAQRAEMIQDLKSNPISQFIGVKGGLPVLGMVSDWFAKRTFTKSSEEIARAMISDKGIQALIDLAAQWKDKAQAIAYIKAITIGSSALDGENQ